MSTSFLPSIFQTHLDNIKAWTNASTFLSDDTLKDHKISTNKSARRTEIIADLNKTINQMFIFSEPTVPVPTDLKAIHFNECASIPLDSEGAGFDNKTFIRRLLEIPHSVYSIHSDGLGDAIDPSDIITFEHLYSFPPSTTKPLDPLFEVATSLAALPTYFLLTRTGELILHVPERRRDCTPNSFPSHTSPLTTIVQPSTPPPPATIAPTSDPALSAVLSFMRDLEADRLRATALQIEANKATTHAFGAAISTVARSGVPTATKELARQIFDQQHLWDDARQAEFIATFAPTFTPGGSLAEFTVAFSLTTSEQLCHTCTTRLSDHTFEFPTLSKKQAFSIITFDFDPLTGVTLDTLLPSPKGSPSTITSIELLALALRNLTKVWHSKLGSRLASYIPNMLFGWADIVPQNIVEWPRLVRCIGTQLTALRAIPPTGSYPTTAIEALLRASRSNPFIDEMCSQCFTMQVRNLSLPPQNPLPTRLAKLTKPLPRPTTARNSTSRPPPSAPTTVKEVYATAPRPAVRSTNPCSNWILGRPGCTGTTCNFYKKGDHSFGSTWTTAESDLYRAHITLHGHLFK